MQIKNSINGFVLNKPFTAGFFFVIIVFGICHLLFSHLGYNPTDDGFTLAYSRRILEGQIPHLDFIIIRPFLSPLLHVPVAVFGGEYTFYLSRFVVWIQLSFIAWIFTFFINKMMGDYFSPLQFVFLSLITFTAAAHTFPITAWHTIDGLMLISIGFLLSLSHKNYNRNLAYIFFAFAYLCKQSFLPVGIGMLILNKEIKNVQRWIAFFIPGFFYLLYLLVNGYAALIEGITQLLSQKGLLSVANYYIVSLWFPAGLVTGFLLSSIIERGRNTGNIATYNLLAAVLLVIVVSLLTGIFHKTSLFIFGIFIAAFIFVARDNKDDLLTKLYPELVVALLALSVSLSLGYPFPVFVAGGFFMLLLRFIFQKGLKIDMNSNFVIAVSVIIFISFLYGRYNYIYREAPASVINSELSEVMHGMKNIRTNANTYRVLADLNSAVNEIVKDGKQYAIIPENAGFWVKADQQNPISIDWVFKTELNKPSLVDRIINDIKNQRGKVVFVLQKYNAEFIARRIEPPLENPVTEYIRQNLVLTGETNLHYFYE